MLETIMGGVISGLMLLIGTMYISKKLEKTIESEKKKAKTEIQAWLNSENGQKALFTIGAIIGNGAKSGFGLTQKTGKFKMEDLIGQIVGNYVLPKVLGQNGLGVTETASKSNSKMTF